MKDDGINRWVRDELAEKPPHHMARSREGRIARVELTLKALEQRKLGMTYDQISKELGIPRTQAYRLVNKALKESLSEPAEELRTLLVGRLDYFLLRLQAGIMKGAPRSIEVALKVEERRAALLGLDAKDKPDKDYDGPIVIEYYRDDRQEKRREFITGQIVAAEQEVLSIAGPSDPSPEQQEEDHGDSGRDGLGKDVDSSALGEAET